MTMVFLFGMCLHLTDSFILSVFLLISSVFCYAIGTILFYFATISKQEYFSRTLDESVPRFEFEESFQQTQSRLALCLLLLLPLFPFVYFLSLFRVINDNATFTLISVLNVVTKLIFSILMNSAHHSAASEVVRLKLAAESLALCAETTANESRRLFVRYIMHEVRVPLSSITMS